MIVVKVELHSALNGEVTEIGYATICNLGTGTEDKGDYYVSVKRRGNRASVVRTGKVMGFSRRCKNVWLLVIRSLLTAFPEGKLK